MISNSEADPALAARRAVVIGGSMAGLITARVLIDHFDEVVLIERDPLPTGPEQRKGVPQGRHLHGLLARGEQLLEKLFPGLLESVLRAGAVRMDWARDMHWHHFGGWKVRYDSGVDVTWLTRPFLESEVRRRVLALSRVRRWDAHEVTGLVLSREAPPARGQATAGIAGVRVRARESDAAEEVLHAALVVDATGRGSVAPKWLEELGYERPMESKVAVHVGYATRTYRRPEAFPFPWKGLYILGTYPQNGRLGAMVPVEDNRFVALVAGQLRDYPPDDHEGWLAFARSLPNDSLYRAALACEPLDEIATYRFPNHQRRHYERMRRLPERFVVVGDALCSFNPIYGQGMTTAALSAIALGECLQASLRRSGGNLIGLSRRYHQQASRLIDIPWLMSTSEDFRHPEVQGQRPPGYRLLSSYLGRVHRVVQHDTRVMGHFLRAMHLLESPMHLFRPDLALRILRG